MRRSLSAAMAVVILLAASAAALETIEDFESLAWPSGSWVTYTGTAGSTSTVANHNGARGYLGAGGWEGNTAVVVGSSGDRLSMWTRHDSSAGTPTRTYLGFSATAGGCYSFVFAPNTGELLIQDNTGWGYVTLATSVLVPLPDHWYRMEVRFGGNSVSCRLYDSDGFTYVAGVSHNFGAPITPGGVAIRTFTTGRMHMDTIELSLRADPSNACTTTFQDFESPTWPVPGWVTASGSVGATVTGAAAHDGTRGFDSNGGWALAENVHFGVTNNRISIWVIHDTASGAAGRVYLGVSGDPTGCRSFVWSPLTNEFIYQDNAGWTYTDIFNFPFVTLSDHWYRIELTQQNQQAIGFEFFDSDGTTSLYSFGISSTSFFNGAIALRTTNGMLVDTIEFSGPPLLEDFESTTWPTGNWVTVSGPADATTSTAAVHDGLRGLQTPESWMLNESIVIGAPGERLSLWTRGSTGRTYLGFSAVPAGAYSFVFAPNSGQILFQENLGYSFLDIASDPFEFVPGAWYRMEIEFVGPNDVIGRIYPADGIFAIARLDLNIPTGYVPGGVALRVFGDSVADTLEDFTPGAPCGCMSFCGDCNHSGTGPDIVDALRSAQIAALLIVPTIDDLNCCDVNSLGGVTILDSLAIAQSAVGLPVVLTCP